MLDLGAQFCRSTPLCSSCPVRRACRWILEGGEDPAPGSAGVSRPQSRFEGSDRQVRGRIIAVLREGPTGERRLAGACRDVEPQRLATILSGLVGEGLVEMAGRSVRLATT
jgi:A/G-specific adenine glycosylase